jgi:ubiquinone/menaquinone biosynthesis C-methylase UbiE
VIRQFPAQPEFARMIHEAGFKGVKYQDLSAGIVSIHSGWKL